MVAMVVSFSIAVAQSSNPVKETAPLKDAKKTVETKTNEEITKEADQKEGPVLKFESRTVDYGTIEQNADPYRYFKFVNSGTEPVIITNAKGSCGCTVPTYPKEPIEPGQEASIKVRYATNRVGPFQKTVTLTTNSAEEKITLTIKGKVNPKPAEPEGVPTNDNKNLFRKNNSKSN